MQTTIILGAIILLVLYILHKLKPPNGGSPVCGVLQ